MEKEINWIVKNWEKIPDSFKTDIKAYGDESKPVEDLPLDEHVVILLLDRQKPSVERSWDFDEERISISRTGKIVWGFDSGCSCPSPWHDRYPECYSCVKNWKEFTVKLKDFDADWLEVCTASIAEIKKATNDK